jgi:hypothetical protein
VQAVDLTTEDTKDTKGGTEKASWDFVPVDVAWQL